MADVKIVVSAQTKAAEALLTQFTNRIQSALGSFATKLTAAFSVAALVGFTKQAINTADEMGKLAQKTGIAVESLSQLSFSANLATVDQGQLQLSLKHLAEQMTKAGKGTADLQEELLRLADDFAAMPDGPEKTALAIDKFGRGGAAMIPLLNQGSEALRKQKEEADELGLTIGPEFAKKAQAFNDNLTRLKAFASGTFLGLAEVILPKLNSALERFIELLKSSGAQEKFISAIAEAFNFMEIALSSAAGQLDYISRSLDQISKRGVLRGLFNVAAGEVSEQIEAEKIGGAPKPIPESFKEAIAEGLQKGEAERSALFTKALYEARGRAEQRTLEGARQQVEITKNKIALEGPTTELLEDLRRHLRDQKDILNRIAGLDQTALQHQVISMDDALARRDEREREKIGIDRQLQDIRFDPNSASDQMQLAMETLRDEFGTTAQIIARGFTSVIGSAVDSVANGISGLIRGTLTWGQALQQIGGSILNGVINAISRMFAEWLAKRTLLFAKELFFSGAEAAAKAPKALFESISSWGVAAVIGAAALGTALAGLSGAFAEGGEVRGPGTATSDSIWGRLSNGEFVIKAAAVQRYGKGLMNAINDTALEAYMATSNFQYPGEQPNFSTAGTLSGGGGVTVSPTPVHVVFVRDEAEYQRYLESQAGKQIMIRTIRDNRNEVGIQS